MPANRWGGVINAAALVPEKNASMLGPIHPPFHYGENAIERIFDHRSAPAG
jgi:hypothetical protein